MRVDPSKSIYHESPDAAREFSRAEIAHLRQLLRRLRFLEHKTRETAAAGGGGNGGEMFSIWEMAALEFALDELGYLRERPKETV